MPAYRYPQFYRELLAHDFVWEGGRPPGEPFPDFEVTTLDGGTLRRDDLLGEPFLIVFASYTWPMTRSARGALHRVHDAYGDRIRFITLCVREAHPGDDYPQPNTLDRKLTPARDYAQRDDITWTVAVDDVEGTLHRQLDAKPHAAYLVGPDGKVVFRTLWANEESVGGRRGRGRSATSTRGAAAASASDAPWHRWDVAHLGAGRRARQDLCPAPGTSRLRLRPHRPPVAAATSNPARSDRDGGHECGAGGRRGWGAAADQKVNVGTPPPQPRRRMLGRRGCHRERTNHRRPTFCCDGGREEEGGGVGDG